MTSLDKFKEVARTYVNETVYKKCKTKKATFEDLTVSMREDLENAYIDEVHPEILEEEEAMFRHMDDHDGDLMRLRTEIERLKKELRDLEKRRPNFVELESQLYEKRNAAGKEVYVGLFDGLEEEREKRIGEEN